jgi:hypothetical protein
VTDDAIAKQDQQITATAEFPGRECQQSLGGQWCLFVGAVPPVMAHAWSAGDLCSQLHRQES